MSDKAAFPDDVKYTAEHEWVSEAKDGVVRIGITDYAQDALGDIVYVSLPDVGDEVASGDAMGELESTKSVSDVFAPVDGTIVGRNDSLDGSPELCNTDPYGDGWLVEIRVTDPATLDALLSAADYERTVTSN
jgi:glycine cleavage system H protein